MNTLLLLEKPISPPKKGGHLLKKRQSFICNEKEPHITQKKENQYSTRHYPI